jgi:gamma-glutamylcysteine synthetase
MKSARVVPDSLAPSDSFCAFARKVVDISRKGAKGRLKSQRKTKMGFFEDN